MSSVYFVYFLLFFAVNPVVIFRLLGVGKVCASVFVVVSFFFDQVSCMFIFIFDQINGLAGEGTFA